MRYRIVRTCKFEGCKDGVTSRSKRGYCRKHKDTGRPKRPFDPIRWQAWLDADPENPKKYRASIRDWARRNPEKQKAADRAYQKRKLAKAALAAVQAMRPMFKANIARVKAEFETRGYLGEINVDRR